MKNDRLKMRYFVLFFALLILLSCKKKEPLLTNEGVITGINPCAYACVINCPCACGNFLFHFTDTGDTSNIIIDNQSIIQLPTNGKYPVRLTLDWQSTTRCGIKAIKVLNYKLL